MGTVAYKLTGRHASFKRYCELFRINLGKPFDKDSHLSPELSAHLFRYAIFGRLYESDYYKKKSITDVAHFLHRFPEDIRVALRKVKPELLSPAVELTDECPALYGISSFELDMALGGNYDFLFYSK